MLVRERERENEKERERERKRECARENKWRREREKKKERGEQETEQPSHCEHTSTLVLTPFCQRVFSGSETWASRSRTGS